MNPYLTALFPFVCVLMRMTGLFVTAPIFGAKFVPAQVKAALALASSFFVAGAVSAAEAPATLAGWLASAAGEVLFGLAMGTICSILLAAVEVAGHIVDVEIGFSMANVIDPAYGTSSALMGTFKYLLISVLFMTLDGHHLFIWGIAESFKVLPAGTAHLPSAWAEVAVGAAGQMMVIAVVLSCPIWVSILITDMALGVMSRSVPQLNVFVVGMPVKLLVGFAVLSASMGFYGAFTEELTSAVKSLIDSLLGVLT